MRLFELSHTSNTPVFQLMNTKLNKVVNITVSMMYLILPQIQTSFRENCFSHINGWIWVSRQTEACCVNMLQTKRPAFPVWIKSTGLVGRSYCFYFLHVFNIFTRAVIFSKNVSFLLPHTLKLQIVTDALVFLCGSETIENTFLYSGWKHWFTWLQTVFKLLA